MKFWKRRSTPNAPHEQVNVPAPLLPRPEERDAINETFPDRSAGRWCAVCGQNGNHHTDRHEEFYIAAREDGQ